MIYIIYTIQSVYSSCFRVCPLITTEQITVADRFPIGETYLKVM